MWSFGREHAERQIQTVATFGENLWGDRKRDHFGDNMWRDPTGGPDWIELVERSKVWSFWRERVKRVKVWSFGREHAERQIQTVVSCGENVWNDRKSGHFGENMWRDPTGGQWSRLE